MRNFLVEFMKDALILIGMGLIAYGIFLTQGFGYACIALGIMLLILGVISIYSKPPTRKG
ncbi:MAG: hypothetical protein GY853_09950 [PVC group bacterium]|nr:hypothetical protein [PVC group bacterium]